MKTLMLILINLVNKIFKRIGKRDSTPEDSIPRDSTPKNLSIKKFCQYIKNP